MKRTLRSLYAAAIVILLCAAGADASKLAPKPTPDASFDSGMLHVDRYGHGTRAIVFIPGLGSGSWTWYEQIAAFDRRYTIYAVTLAGFDGLPATAVHPLFPGFANDFFAMLDSQHVSKPVVVGHSLGGTLAIYLAEQHPERLAGIVAADGLPVFPRLAYATQQQRDAAAAQTASISGLSHEQLLAYDKNYMATIGTADASFAPQLAELSARSDARAVAAWAAEDLSNDLRPNLKNISIPMLEIMPYDATEKINGASFTEAQSLGFYSSLIAGAPHATVEPVSGARHFVMIDQPATFDALLTRFLQTAWPD